MLFSAYPKRRGGGRSRARWYAQRAVLTRYSWRGRRWEKRGKQGRGKQEEKEEKETNHIINNNNFITIYK